MIRAPAFAVPLLVLLAAPVAANPYLDGCLDPSAPAPVAADQCRRAADWGDLEGRPLARVRTTQGLALSEMGRDGDALAAFDAALAAEGGHQPAWAARAVSRARRGRLEGAFADWREALRRDPRDWRSRLARAGWLIRDDRPAEALEDLDRAARIAPEQPDVAYTRGLALAALDRREAARAAFSRAIRLNPRDAQAHLRRALARAPEDPRGALADLDSAIRLDPEWAAAWATRGRLLERMDRPAEATRDYRRAFELGLQAPWLNERIEALGG